MHITNAHVIARLAELRDLKPRWYGLEYRHKVDDSTVLSPERFAWAEEFILRLLEENIIPPYLYPVYEGGISMEWGEEWKDAPITTIYEDRVEIIFFDDITEDVTMWGEPLPHMFMTRLAGWRLP